MKIAYLVSRFPHVSETFIVRELDALDATGAVELEVLSLFPPASTTVHPTARPWLRRLHRPSAAEGMRALAWWLRRRPLRLLGLTARIVAGHARRPYVLARALATLPLAAAHARRLQGSGVERVHAHYATYPTLSAWICERLTGIPYSFTVHAHDIFVDQSMLRAKVDAADFVVAISEYNRGFLAVYGGEAATPVEVVHCGIDVSLYPFRPRLVRPAGPVSAVCVASLQEYKGHAVLLEALAAATAAGSPASRLEVELIGEGSLREDLEARAVELDLGTRVSFRGALPEEEVRAALDRAAIFVLPSIVAADGQMEGLPVSIMEALASGLLVVSTRLSGIPEIVHDGETGLLAEPGDASSLRGALDRAVDGSGVDAAAGRAEVEAEYDVAESAARLLALFTAARRS